MQISGAALPNWNLSFAIARFPARVPFTLLMLAALGVRAWRTDSGAADLPQRVLQRVGFAPRDLLSFSWRRLISSALFTHGRMEFWVAVVMVVAAVGILEWSGGTIVAAVTFWGVHVVTLLVESLFVALPLKLAGAGIGARLSDVRDVGPSAGYVGALGLLCALLPRPWRNVAAAVVVVGLVYVVFAPDEHAVTNAARLSADIAHFIAFPLGWYSLALWRRLREVRAGAA
ncbi:MAG: hypothetical protein ACYC9X_14540 [Dehalococcoidia bacterium]